MAVMWPRILPADVTGSILRNTECEVFRKLEEMLDDSFVIYYSRPWLGLRPDGEEIDGECDFVVAHARLGLLTLEVKGGAVAYDPHTDQWHSRDRWGITHKIKNPVRQARAAKHQLLKKLKLSPSYRIPYIRARHGVILPHSSEPAGILGADMPPGIFCFYEQYNAGIGDWILERFGVPADADHISELGAGGLKVLESILAKPFQLRTPLAAQLARDNAAIQMLTQQQLHIIRGIEALPRVAISGAAGTGKTVLAMEEAVRCAQDGARTLFSCYNRGLASEVRGHLRSHSLISVMTFHELCAELTRRAGISCPKGISERQMFEDVWPELLMQSFENLSEERYDAIVVDEGQDFQPLWWAAIESGLNPTGRGLLRIFYDCNQRVYSGAFRLPIDVDTLPYRLTLNLRNTRRIHELVCNHYLGYEITAIGPEGAQVRWISAGTFAELRERLYKCLTNLHFNERIALHDIAILFSSEKEVEKYFPSEQLGGLSAVRCDKRRPAMMVVDSIRRFKGLESLVVIIVATHDTIIDEELPYVALSRARTHLVVIGDDQVLNIMRTGMRRFGGSVSG